MDMKDHARKYRRTKGRKGTRQGRTDEGMEGKGREGVGED